MRLLGAVALVAFAAVLLRAMFALPRYGDPRAPAHAGLPASRTAAAEHYIRAAYEEAHARNVVTVVLADYRSFDTLGEALVVFTGAVSCTLLLRGRP